MFTNGHANMLTLQDSTVILLSRDLAAGPISAGHGSSSKLPYSTPTLINSLHLHWTHAAEDSNSR